MNRNFILVLILLATFFMVKHHLNKSTTTTSFIQCPLENVATLTVTLSPDPLVPGSNDTFIVSGTLSQDITSDTFLGINFADSNEHVIDMYRENFCDGNINIPCPIPSGTEFTITSDVPVPSDLPMPNYYVAVLVGDPPYTYGCAYHNPYAGNDADPNSPLFSIS